METYYDVPQPVKPVSLQPFKTLKIVFMILAIVLTAFLLIYGVIMGALGVLINSFDSAAGTEIGEFFEFGSVFIMLCSYIPIDIAFWVLFFVFNAKYRGRVAHNRSLGLYD